MPIALPCHHPPPPPAVCAIRPFRRKVDVGKFLFFCSGCCRAPKMRRFSFYFSALCISILYFPFDRFWLQRRGQRRVTVPHAHNHSRVGVPAVVLLYLATDTEGQGAHVLDKSMCKGKSKRNRKTQKANRKSSEMSMKSEKYGWEGSRAESLLLPAL